MSKISASQQRMESVATNILNKRTLSDRDLAILEEYKSWNPDQAEWIDEALSLFDTKEKPPA